MIDERYITGSACLIFFNKQARRGRNVSFFYSSLYSSFIVLTKDLIHVFTILIYYVGTQLFIIGHFYAL